MTVPTLLAGAGAAFTLLLGLGGLILPRLAQRITLLAPVKSSAIAEMRASFGGLYLGIGIAVLMAMWAEQDVVGATFAAACLWLGLASGRLVSLVADRSWSGWNFTSLCIETGVGLMLAAPFIAHIAAHAG